jgi:hypothetical protein
MLPHHNPKYGIILQLWYDISGAPNAAGDHQPWWLILFCAAGLYSCLNKNAQCDGCECNIVSNDAVEARCSVCVQVIISHGGSYDPALLDSIAASLAKAGLQERCGDLYQHLNRPQDALQAYRKGHAYRCAYEKN